MSEKQNWYCRMLSITFYIHKERSLLIERASLYPLINQGESILGVYDVGDLLQLNFEIIQ